MIGAKYVQQGTPGFTEDVWHRIKAVIVFNHPVIMGVPAKNLITTIRRQSNGHTFPCHFTDKRSGNGTAVAKWLIIEMRQSEHDIQSILFGAIQLMVIST